ncbi:SusC/RagA family TonB-linked outer membrane protein [Rhodohalobacter sulfatireducens]|uniref:SusC/RagA family TonB-linked outer membrane protein n=1 Tax=Rhodohalobacter sulfatireducens TaxID=2911366 RepID=A0ABS9KGY6_9BACT|nr:SusC/RagA family TonB-linked outer membrane protein [Rhodohalobacter sulfatireducens]MCG2590110.1 SusC/RagA family TonB-linked outer membrane protein [Rhodohalobacter sulfatireducens]MDR9365639.1 SusC/RagA family TonB-linked outer membrane protein [Balneolaceae bacterium]MDR9409965.1 SusC/RagA family TonB-linked outer membrane protein [Balneolaceae bacterium]
MSSAYAQTGTLTGTVTDSRTGEELPGVNIYIPDIDRGAVTNLDGVYSIQSIPTGEYNVTASFIGYVRQELTLNITAGNNTVDIELRQDLVGLDEIVVTGQQIERQERALAYSISTVTGEEVTKARETNFVDALAGKVPGVEVQSQSGNIGASTRITIRGISSLSGSNQPLFVVDGVPISNSNIVGNTSQDRLTGAVDVGNRGGDLNADDIESVTVLKGAASAALYGQRAKDGVILITTKRGSAQTGQSVTVNSSVRTSSPLRLPDFQNEYAQGDNGKYDSNSLNGWGPPIAGQQVENIRGEEVTLQAYPDNVKDFYNSNLTAINSISFSNADEISDLRVAVTRTDQSGIVPNNTLDRTAITVNTGRNMTENFQVRLSGTYTDLSTTGRAVAGGNDPNVLTSLINTLPRTTNLTDLKNYKNEDGTQRALSSQTNNPYWIVNENPFENTIQRVFGNAQARYSPLDWLTLTARAGLDYYTEDRQRQNSVGTLGRDDGDFSLDIIQEEQINVDLLAEIVRDINEDISFQGVVGYNLNTREQSVLRNTASTLDVPGLLNFANASSNNPSNYYSQRRLLGVFADVTFGYKNYLFLNATGRNDWSSTLPEDNNSFFYPSINTSFVFTEAFDVAGNILSYGKLRANYAQVGSDEAPYQLDFRYFPVSSIFGQYGTGQNFPFGGRTGFNATGTLPPQDLKPQLQKSFEVGAELQFFDGRFGFDFTYYDVRTEDQIISIPTPETTGFGALRTNIGEVSNKGIELSVNLNPIRTSTFNHVATVNFTTNQNVVESLAPGVDEIVIQSAFNGLQVRAEPGKPLGLYGPGFLRDEDTGELIINPDTGLIRTGGETRLGKIDPDYRLSLNNQFNYKGLNFSFLLDYRQGGVLFSQTVGSLRRAGVAEETLENRGGTFIIDGLVENADGSYSQNTTPVQDVESFWNNYASANVHEGNTFSSTYVKLREVKVEYELPRRWIENTPLSSLTVGVEGRNLFLLYSEVPHIDPETGLFGSASNGQGIEWNVLPSTRSYGANIQLRF